MDKYELKSALVKGTDIFFDKLFETLNPDSYFYNDFLLLKMRYNRTQSEVHKNTLSVADRNLEFDRISIALIEYLDKLTDEDFKTGRNVTKQGAQHQEKKFIHFWKSFFDKRTTIVIGTYYGERFRRWEASTLMGTGDAIALGKIMGVLNNVGIKEIDVVPAYNFNSDRYQDNLVLLGGPDANKLTREVYGRLETNFKFGDPDKNEITFFDTKEAERYFPSFGTDNRVYYDYGLAIKTINPFNIDTDVIILAGCYGFGTCAAAQLFESTKLLNTIEGFESEKGFEALVHSDVIDDWTQKPKLVRSYRL